MSYLLLAIACLSLGFVGGYLVCFRNPPDAILRKVDNRIKGVKE